MADPFGKLRPVEPLMDACVHCGFCLATCPSYLLLGQEMDSPRGRIYLMKAGVEERVAMSSSLVGHFDTCLGCMACETACPSGVHYAPLIEETRAAIDHHHRRSLGDRLFRGLLFTILPFPRRLRLLALPMVLTRWIARSPRLLARLPARLRALLSLAPPTSLGEVFRDLPERTDAVGDERRRVGLVTGCVQRAFFGRVNLSTARVLAAEGCAVVAPSGQGCCGALALHAGRDDDARGFAKGLIATFERANVDEVAVNAAGCGSAMKEYGRLFQHDPEWAERAARFSAKVHDVTETLAGLGAPRAARHPVPGRVAYHDACHLAHAQNVRREPRELLAAIPGLTVVPLAGADICCGSAGIFNLVEPDLAAELGRRKARSVADADVSAVVTTNPGCMLQIAVGGRDKDRPFPPVLHIVELLEASIYNRQILQ